VSERSDAVKDVLTLQERAGLAEIIRLLDEAYRHYFENSDGHCKSAEGYVEVAFGTYFDRNAGRRVRPTSVYSYVLGPSRSHHFDSVAEALDVVREWHAAEMAHDYAADEAALAAWGKS
jgi:hypothetical protein